MSLSTVKLTLQQKLDFLPAIASIALAGFYALLTGLWRTEREAKTLFLHFGYAIFRQATARLTPSQMQYILPSSDKIYERYAKKNHIQAQSVELGYGALGHWVGDRNATNVLVWYHGKHRLSKQRSESIAHYAGGGFGLPANMGYFKFYAHVIRDLQRAGKSIAVFGLTYTLAPHATYPTQLKQAVSAVRYILSQPNRDPATVFLGGDSAGGNLVGGVLSHAAHPHPEIEPLDLTANFGGAAMIAPWTLLDTEFPEQEIYHGGDIITQAVAQPWASGYLGNATRDNYTDLSNAPIDWYENFPVNQVLLTGGEHEILLPIIRDLAEKFKKGFQNVELFVGRRECHVAPIYNLELGDSTETEQGKKVKSWLTELAL
ncbi:hypothetical protein N7448_005810 [Penicillium atrosanguineum]|uniref:Alpha/beta hydrolase fold-3 domain-containing protein n=1 Tax=Penicillium atrosanguineum TaxID=1132637 RepID=A0A9W9GX37_9EURO|nr:uncharacterized protein N7443_009573 [Penicillium atrosanguineum]KAJ5131652.1 hypothetical protein N7448_005810 [Penicillium atrosanguineum]KAJ5138143.1 hypothetical protein N7526_004376 [Penicillium atrosanguineum]KAJ5289320.1 hypothetical protein N7443_009573 [Penicillium atrosanguineum]KAJ5307134.1 hypothetical protein N7476_007790 [Penicillium atrosanguineum]